MCTIIDEMKSRIFLIKCDMSDINNLSNQTFTHTENTNDNKNADNAVFLK